MSEPPVKTRPPRRAPPKASNWIAPEIRRLAVATGALDPALIEAWPLIVGPQLGKLCRPVGLKKRGKSSSLVVSASSGAAATRIQFAQAEILSRAADYLNLRSLRKLEIEQKGAGPKRTSRWKTQHTTAETLRKTPKRVATRPARDVNEALENLRRALREGPTGE